MSAPDMGYELLPTVEEAHTWAQSVRARYVTAEVSEPLGNADRSLVRDLTRPAARGRGFFCVFCGAPSFGAACPSHRDLIQIDPGMGGIDARSNT